MCVLFCDFLIPICQNVKAMTKACIILLNQKEVATYTGYTRKRNVGKLWMITVMNNRNLKISLIMTDLSQYPWNWHDWSTYYSFTWKNKVWWTQVLFQMIRDFWILYQFPSLSLQSHPFRKKGKMGTLEEEMLFCQKGILKSSFWSFSSASSSYIRVVVYWGRTNNEFYEIIECWLWTNTKHSNKKVPPASIGCYESHMINGVTLGPSHGGCRGTPNSHYCYSILMCILGTDIRSN